MTNPEFLAAMEVIIGPSDFFQHKQEIEAIPDYIRPIVYVAASFGASIERLLILSDRLKNAKEQATQNKPLYQQGGISGIVKVSYPDKGEFVALNSILQNQIKSLVAIQQSCNAAAHSMRELSSSFARLRKKLKDKKRFTKRLKNDLPRKRKKAFKKLIQSF